MGRAEAELPKDRGSEAGSSGMNPECAPVRGQWVKALSGVSAIPCGFEWSSKPVRLMGLLVVLLAAAVLIIGSASGATHAGTTEYIFAPFTSGSVASGLRIVKTVRGNCWTGSEGTARADAWRCMSGNLIYDPCFSDQSSGGGRFVVCAQSPFVRTLVKFVLAKPLPYSVGNKEGDPTKFDPWGVRLASGVTCVNIQGATGAIAGMRIGYFCSNQGVLVGSPKRTTATWRIFFAKSFKAPSLTLAPISQAWW